MNNKPHAHTLNLVDTIYDKLPPPTQPGLDYEDLRGRVQACHAAIRGAINTLLAQKRIEVVKGGLRNRKLFRRAQKIESASA